MSGGLKPKAASSRLILKGVGVSPGVVVGPVWLLSATSSYVEERELEESHVHDEIRRLERAVIETRRQITEIQHGLESQTVMAESDILDAHLMVLDDNAFQGEIIDGIRKQRKNAEFIVRQVGSKYADAFASLKDSYFSERVIDVKDVSRRLMRNLSSGPEKDEGHGQIPAGHIVVAEDLTPSEAASFRRDHVGGIATDYGSVTSHTALLAKALEIPAVVALREATPNLRQGDPILIDGTRGILILNPNEEDLAQYQRFADERKTIEHNLEKLKALPAETLDGHRIVLSANTESIDELNAVIEYGAEGVGLFRSEYLYIASDHSPGEDEQAQIYKEAAERLAPNPFIVRTCDLGGDKSDNEGGNRSEPNPFLGCRSIRLSLRNPDVFKVQLRAILRASVHGNVKIMYPMISGVQEVIRANEILREAMAELDALGMPYNADIDVGVMIEIPSAALCADVLAPHVQFFSLGTNDLTQYTLAVDRINERVASLFRPTHPAVLKLVRETVAVGHRHNLWVGVCGEMAANPILSPLLVGLGVDELSVYPQAVPMVKDAIRKVDLQQARDLATRIENCGTADEVTQFCRELTQKVSPELLELV